MIAELQSQKEMRTTRIRYCAIVGPGKEEYPGWGRRFIRIDIRGVGFDLGESAPY